MKLTQQLIINASAERIWTILAHDFATVGDWISSITNSVPDMDVETPDGATRGVGAWSHASRDTSWHMDVTAPSAFGRRWGVSPREWRDDDLDRPVPHPDNEAVLRAGKYGTGRRCAYVGKRFDVLHAIRFPGDPCFRRARREHVECGCLP